MSRFPYHLYMLQKEDNVAYVPGLTSCSLCKKAILAFTQSFKRYRLASSASWPLKSLSGKVLRYNGQYSYACLECYEAHKDGIMEELERKSKINTE